MIHFINIIATMYKNKAARNMTWGKNSRNMLEYRRKWLETESIINGQIHIQKIVFDAVFGITKLVPKLTVKIKQYE